MAGDAKRTRGQMTWALLIRVSTIKWHQWGRLIAALILADQWAGPLGGIPSSEAVVVVALGALFAPVPSKKDD